MTTKPLYVVLLRDNLIMSRQQGLPARLELRTNIDWVQNYSFRRNDAGELILSVPEPIIQLAHGTQAEVLEFAHRMLCAVPNEIDKWEYHGDFIWSFRLDDLHCS